MNNNIDILTLSLEEAWEMFIMLNSNTSSNEYTKARWGVKIMFDIYEHLNGAILQKMKVGKVHIKGKAYESSDFHSELEIRKKIIKNWLVENTSEEGIYRAREKKR